MSGLLANRVGDLGDLFRPGYRNFCEKFNWCPVAPTGGGSPFE